MMHGETGTAMFERLDQVAASLGRDEGDVRVLLVGDLMLDRYLWGEVRRVSPEAPVPVVRVQRRTAAPGGAGNVAMNLVGLGATVLAAGYVGDDGEGRQLADLLSRAGVDTGAVLALDDRPTTTKTRIIGRAQQMLRLDEERALPGAEATEQRLLDAVAAHLEGPVDAVVLSDYAKGVLGEDVCRRIIGWSRARGLPVYADPKGRELERYRGATTLTPNRAELAHATGLDGRDLGRLAAAGRELAGRLELEFLIVTLGEDGILLLDAGTEHHVPTEAREVYDVSGAGDTVLASLAVSAARGLARADAVALANLAAGITVGRAGTAPVKRGELLDAVVDPAQTADGGKLGSAERVARRVIRWRDRGERVVFTNGCFDILHAGHVSYLQRARGEGERLVVGLNSDRSVRAIKGEQRPVQIQGDRARILAGLACVDAVVVFDDSTPLPLIERLRPDVLVKGADYEEHEIVGAAETLARGGRVVRVPLAEGRSTSAILDRVRSVSPRDGE